MGRPGDRMRYVRRTPCTSAAPRTSCPFLYAQGASAVMDILKCFHMFLTIPAERKNMGPIHPLSGAHHWYATCPMGTRNSPGASGRAGNAFIRMLVEGCPLLHGTPRRNEFLIRLAGEPFNACFGTGRIEIGDDRRPVCRSWIHVDDVLLHRLSTMAVGEVLTFEMDLALELGLVC
jgi:hypothetical protein